MNSTNSTDPADPAETLTDELTPIAQVVTEIGTIDLGHREAVNGAGRVYEINVDGSLLMSSVSPVSEKRLTTSGLAMHPGQGPLRVLVGGLGLGYTAQAALGDARVASIRVVEKMRFVIDWMDQGLLPLSKELAADPRVEIVQGDVYDDLLSDPTETYDLILVDVDHAPDDPLSPDSEPFYTLGGQTNVARHLRPGGVLGVWSAFDDEDFARVLAQVYPEGYREEVTWPDEESDDGEYQNMLFFARVPTSTPT